MREAFLSILFFFISSIILGQSKFDKKNASIAHRLPDSALQKPGEKGVLTADLRYLFMATDNRQGLTDYAANALGAGLKYTTGNFHGFSIGAGIYACINIRSSVLTEPDPLTGQINRYEITLFDVIHPEKKLVGGIGELFLKYRWRDSYVSIGRQLINTPFINMQDGRMRPNEAGGVYAEMRAAKKIKISLGYLWEMLPRSTNDWGSISKTIGAYPQGVTVNGTKSGYAGSLKSKGILMAGVNGSFGTKGELNLQLSEVFVENIFNTIMLQGNYEIKGSRKMQFTLSGQLIRQDAVNGGGNNDPAKSYFEANGKSFILGSSARLQVSQWDISFNYTRITKAGRFLFPREWGKEPLFTFLPRERSEGLGNVNAYMIKVKYDFEKARLAFESGSGLYILPTVSDFRYNKYGMTSYFQENILVEHTFSRKLEGMKASLLFVYKGKYGNDYVAAKNIINKVNVSLWSLQLNYLLHYSK